MSASEKQQFRNHFWNSVCRSVSEEANSAAGWERTISRWPAEYDTRPRLKNIEDAVAHARALLSTIKHAGMFLKGMNNTKLLNLDAQARADKLLAAWIKQLGVRDFPIRLMPDDIDLPDSYPLFDWLSVNFSGNFHRLLDPIENFFSKTESVLRNMPEGTVIERRIR